VVVVLLLLASGMEAFFLFNLATWADSALALEQQYLFEEELEMTKPNLDAAAFTL
jgi:hypothetical protein